MATFGSGKLAVCDGIAPITQARVLGTKGNGVGFSSFTIPSDYNASLNSNLILKVSYDANVHLTTGNTGEYNVIISGNENGNDEVINYAIVNSGTTAPFWPYPLKHTLEFTGKTFLPDKTYYVGFYGIDETTYIYPDAWISVSFDYVPAAFFNSGKLNTTIAYVGTTDAGKAYASFTIPSNFDSSNTKDNMIIYLDYFTNIKLIGTGNGEYHYLISSSQSGNGDILDYSLWNPGNNSGASSNNYYYPLGPGTRALTGTNDATLNKIVGNFSANTTYYVGLRGTNIDNCIDAGAYLGVRFYYVPTGVLYLKYYSSTMYYKMHNVVFYNENFYACINPCINVAPTNIFNWILFDPVYRGFLYNIYNDMSGGYNKYDIVLWTDQKFYMKTDMTIFGLNPDVEGSGWGLFVDRTASMMTFSSTNNIGDIYVKNISSEPLNLYFNKSTSDADENEWTRFVNKFPKYYGGWSSSAYYNYGDIIINNSEFIIKVIANLVHNSSPHSISINESTWTDNYKTITNSGTFTYNNNLGTTNSLYDCGLYNGAYYININGDNIPINDPVNMSVWTLMNSLAPYSYKGSENTFIPYKTDDIIYQDSTFINNRPGWELINRAFYIGIVNNFLGYIPNGGTNGIGIPNSNWAAITPSYCGSFFSIRNNTANGYNNYDIVLYDDGYFYIKTNYEKYGKTPLEAESGWTLFLSKSCVNLSATTNTISGEIWFNNASGSSPDLKYHDITDNTLTNISPKFYGLYNNTTYYNYGDVVVGDNWSLYECSGNLVVGVTPSITSPLWKNNIGNLSWVGAWPTASTEKYAILTDSSNIFYVNIDPTNESIGPAINEPTKWVPLTVYSDLIYLGAPDINKPYLVNDVVFDVSGNNKFFICTSSQTDSSVFNNSPSTRQGNWAQFVPSYCGYANTEYNYDLYDVVYYSINDTMYIYLADAYANNQERFNGATNNGWHKFVKGPLWTSDVSYSYGNIVLFGQSAYVNIGSTTANPVQDTINWLPIKEKQIPNYCGNIGDSPFPNAPTIEGNIGFSSTDSFYVYKSGAWSLIPNGLTYRGSLYNIYNDMSGGYNIYDIVLWEDGRFYIKMDESIYGKTPDTSASGWRQFLDLVANNTTLNATDPGNSLGSMILYDNDGSEPMNIYYNNTGTASGIENYRQIQNKFSVYYGEFSPSTFYNYGDIFNLTSGWVIKVKKNLVKNLETDIFSGDYYPNTNNGYDYIDLSGTITLTDNLSGHNLYYKSNGLIDGISYKLYECGVYNGAYYININGNTTQISSPVDMEKWTLMNSIAPYAYKGYVKITNSYIVGDIVCKVQAENVNFFTCNTNSFIGYIPYEQGDATVENTNWTQISPVYRGSLYTTFNDISGGYKINDTVLYENGYFYIKTDDTKYGKTPLEAESGWTFFLKESVLSSVFSTTTIYSRGNIVTWEDDGTITPKMYYYKKAIDSVGSWNSDDWGSFGFKPVTYYGDWNQNGYYNIGDLVFGSDGNMYECINNKVKNGLGPGEDIVNWRIYRYALSAKTWSPFDTYNKGDCVFLGNEVGEQTVLRALIDGLQSDGSDNTDFPIYTNPPTKWKYVATTNKFGVEYSVKTYPIPIAWSVENPYDRGDIVFDSSGNNYYVSIVDSNSLQPSLDISGYSWIQMTNNFKDLNVWDGPIYRGIWDSTLAYIEKDIVLYNNHLYLCLTNNFIREPTDSSSWKPINIIYGGLGSEGTDFTGGPYSIVQKDVNVGRYYDIYNISYWPGYRNEEYNITGPSLWIQTDPSGSDRGWYSFIQFADTGSAEWSATNTYKNGDIIFYNGRLFYSTIDNNNNYEPLEHFNTLWVEIPDGQPLLQNAWSSANLYTYGNIVFVDGLYYVLSTAYSLGDNPTGTSGIWTEVQRTNLSYCGYIANADTSTKTDGYPLYGIILGKYDYLYINIPGSNYFLPLVNSFLKPTINVSGDTLSPGDFIIHNGILYNNDTIGYVTLTNASPELNGATPILSGLVPITSGKGSSTIILSGENGTHYIQKTFIEWKPVSGTDVSGFNCIAYNKIWVAGGIKGGLYWSPNGDQWTVSDSTINLTKVNAVCSDISGDTWFAGGIGATDSSGATGLCLYVSYDGGRTWTGETSDLTTCYTIVFYKNSWIFGGQGTHNLIYCDNNVIYWSNVSIQQGPSTIKTICTDGSGNWLVGGTSSGSNATMIRLTTGLTTFNPTVKTDVSSFKILFPNGTNHCKSIQYDLVNKKFIIIGDAGLESRYGSVVIGSTNVITKTFTYSSEDKIIGNLVVSSDKNIPYLALSETYGLIYSWDFESGNDSDISSNLLIKNLSATNNTDSIFWSSSSTLPETGKATVFNMGPNTTSNVALDIIYPPGTRTSGGVDTLSDITGFNVTGLTSTGFTLIWTGGSSYKSQYTVGISPSNGTSNIISSSRATFSNLNSYTNYTVTVSCTDSLISKSAQYNVKTLLTSITFVNVTNVTANSFTVNWTGGSTNASFYTIKLNDIEQMSPVITNGNRISFTGLMDDTDYIVDITCTNPDVPSNTSNINYTVRTLSLPLPICLLSGTKVLTPNGWESIEDISVGKYVYNHNLKPVKILKTHKWDIQWGTKIFGETVYKIKKGEYGSTEDIYISAFHKILVNNFEMVEAYQLGLPKATKNEIAPRGTYTLCHIHLEDYFENNFIIGGNCIVESWDGNLITTSRANTNNIKHTNIIQQYGLEDYNLNLTL